MTKWGHSYSAAEDPTEWDIKSNDLSTVRGTKTDRSGHLLRSPIDMSTPSQGRAGARGRRARLVGVRLRRYRHALLHHQRHLVMLKSPSKSNIAIITVIATIVISITVLSSLLSLFLHNSSTSRTHGHRNGHYNVAKSHAWGSSTSPINFT